jgi:hypothetical protein
MGSRRRRRMIVLLVALAVTWTSVQAPSAWANDPPFVGWTAVLPPLTHQYDPNSLDDCVAGRVECVESTIQLMQNRMGPLAAACDHHAVFALAYLRTTQSYLQYSETPGFLSDPAFVNHEDAAFAQMYFDAYDDWAAGRVDLVPPAWRIALGAADTRKVSGMGDLLLGMNAHVNRDLPFVLAGIGLTAPDGTSRKPDHDRINIVLNRVVEPLIVEESAHFDPKIAVAPTPYGVGYTGLMQTLLVWRETAWREAELLVSAPDPATRDLVARQIEAYAATTASALLTTTAYLRPLTATTTRDNYCAQQTPVS